jgi:hypothetical protein
MRDKSPPLIFDWRDDRYDHIIISHYEGYER